MKPTTAVKSPKHNKITKSWFTESENYSSYKIFQREENKWKRIKWMENNEINEREQNKW